MDITIWKIIVSAQYVEKKEDGNVKAIIEMKKCVGAMKLAGSHHLAKTYEGHLEKILASS